MSGAEEQRSIEHLARELAQPMMRYLARYVGDQAVAEDLWQETLVRIHRGLASFEGRSSIKTWAFSIASRVAADYLRHQGRSAGIVELAEVAEPTDSDKAIEEQMVIDEMNQCVRGVIDTLPDDYRSALILHDLEGLTAKQVAEVCGCSLASAKIRIHRARSRLKEAMHEECDFYHDEDCVLRCESKARGAPSVVTSRKRPTE